MLLLGGNMGDVRASIERAAELLEERVGMVVKRSSMMQSEAWGFEEQTAPFVNQAIELECGCSPEELLDLTQAIEQELGRRREEEAQLKARSGERYCSRSIDIDIIFYGERSYESERLTIPHPLMHRREFVLRPIVEIAAKWQSVVLGHSCEELLDDLLRERLC